MHSHPATRAQAEALLHAFAPRMGHHYASGRNHDFGPGARRDVSGLSPFVRRRLVSERDLVATALAAHGPRASEKFVQEVIWRGYFKGWLERRPGIWTSYRTGRDNDLALMDSDHRLRRAVAAALSGTTGLACFDAWARELTTTGYLHNHARMWFASIWIFTLRLPWRLGADFFLRHLLDGDPASNTLGWRWVAGLHTRGKAYAATASNIAQFTGGRFMPRDADLAAHVEALETTEPEGLPPVSPLRIPLAPQPGVPSLLLITEEDCRPEDFDLAPLDIRAVATLAASNLRSSLPVPGHIAEFEGAALADAAARIARATTHTYAPATPLHAGAPRDLATFAARVGARQIVTPFIPQGPLHDWLQAAAPYLDAQGIRLCEWQRDWDRAIWPHATAGFFKVKRQIPDILRTIGLADAGVD